MSIQCITVVYPLATHYFGVSRRSLFSSASAYAIARCNVFSTLHVNRFSYDSVLSLSDQPDVVLWVQGRASGSYHRSVIREALINRKLWPSDVKLVALFFVGKHKNRKVQHVLEYEFEQFGDIVQNDYMGKCTSLYVIITSNSGLSMTCTKKIMNFDPAYEKINHIRSNNVRKLN